MPPWFDVVKLVDKTEDYRLTGVKDRKHFQAVKIRLTPRKLAYVRALLLLDPFVIHRLLYYKQDSWMFFYGDNAYSHEYDADYRKSVSRVLLYWITLKRKHDQPAGSKPSHDVSPSWILCGWRAYRCSCCLYYTTFTSHPT